MLGLTIQLHSATLTNCRNVQVETQAENKECLIQVLRKQKTLQIAYTSSTVLPAK